MEASMYIEHTWHQLEAGLKAKGFRPNTIANMRLSFTAGLCAANVAIVNHQATVADMIQAIDWLEPGLN